MSTNKAEPGDCQQANALASSFLDYYSILPCKPARIPQLEELQLCDRPTVACS